MSDNALSPCQTCFLTPARIGKTTGYKYCPKVAILELIIIAKNKKTTPRISYYFHKVCQLLELRSLKMFPHFPHPTITMHNHMRDLMYTNHLTQPHSPATWPTSVIHTIIFQDWTLLPNQIDISGIRTYPRPHYIDEAALPRFCAPTVLHLRFNLSQTCPSPSMQQLIRSGYYWSRFTHVRLDLVVDVNRQYPSGSARMDWSWLNQLTCMRELRISLWSTRVPGAQREVSWDEQRARIQSIRAEVQYEHILNTTEVEKTFLRPIVSDLYTHVPSNVHVLWLVPRQELTWSTSHDGGFIEL